MSDHSYRILCECGNQKPRGAEACDRCATIEASGRRRVRVGSDKQPCLMLSSVKAGCNRALRKRGIIADF